MVCYVYLCGYRCPSCHRELYAVNLRAEQIPCWRYGEPAYYAGRKKVLVESYEEYLRLVEGRVFEAELWR